MAANKSLGQGGGKRSEVDERNMVEVMLGDLPKEEQCRVKEEMKRELEELETIRMHEKLACYQKTQNGVVQKANIAKASSSKVNPSTLSPEDIVHLVGVSVSSKYGMDLVQLTQDVRSTLDSFKHDLDDSLPRQVKSVVKEVLGNTQGKQMADTASASTP
jgi:hypothetical protein